MRAECLSQLGDEFRTLERRRVHRYLVGAVIQNGARVTDATDAAGDTEGNVDAARDIVHPALVHHAPVAAGGDVIEDELVHSLVGVTLPQLEDIPHIAVVAELDALDHAPIAHVEAGDDAFRQQAWPPFAARASAAFRSIAPS